MRLISALIITAIMASHAAPALAKSLAERERLKQSTNFESKTTPAYATSITSQLTPSDPSDGGDDVIAQESEEKNCASDSRFLRPLVNTLGSIAGIFIGGSVGGSGTGQQVGRVLGGAATGMATNEAMREICEE